MLLILDDLYLEERFNHVILIFIFISFLVLREKINRNPQRRK